MSHDRVLWILQWVFGLYFIAFGVVHFVVPDGLPTQLEWMYDLDDTLHLVSGTAEVLGGLGLILPSLTRLQPRLTALAALGLLGVMIGAILWHAGRGEWANIGINVVNAVVLGYIAYGRSRIAPFPSR